MVFVQHAQVAHARGDGAKGLGLAAIDADALQTGERFAPLRALLVLGAAQRGKEQAAFIQPPELPGVPTAGERTHALALRIEEPDVAVIAALVLFRLGGDERADLSIRREFRRG